ncbi:hypothetical protein EDB19DRAFT_1644982, partial [Suillus lakei]
RCEEAAITTDPEYVATTKRVCRLDQTPKPLQVVDAFAWTNKDPTVYFAM